MGRAEATDRAPARARILVLLVALVGVSACRPFYVLRVGIEHLRYVSRARPIEEVIAETSDPVRRRRLELILDARRFAARNGLDVGGSYEKIADTKGLALGWVVTAAYQDRLEPYEWSYPIVGRVPYRGYFDRAQADGFAAKLEREGYDTYVFPAAGYSTLGWFDDPAPSSLLESDDIAVVEVVLHEIVHQTVYVKDAIAFNETLASAIAKRMVEEFFARRGEEALAAEARRRREAWLAESRLFDAFAERLEALFAGLRGAPREKLLAERARIYADLERELRATDGGQALRIGEATAIRNNAVFLALWRYRRRAELLDTYVRGFDDWLAVHEDLRALEKEAEAGEADPFDLVAARVAGRGRVLAVVDLL